jgi:hypothetical protein
VDWIGRPPRVGCQLGIPLPLRPQHLVVPNADCHGTPGARTAARRQIRHHPHHSAGRPPTPRTRPLVLTCFCRQGSSGRRLSSDHLGRGPCCLVTLGRGWSRPGLAPLQASDAHLASALQTLVGRQGWMKSAGQACRSAAYAGGALWGSDGSSSGSPSTASLTRCGTVVSPSFSAFSIATAYGSASTLSIETQVAGS